MSNAEAVRRFSASFHAAGVRSVLAMTGGGTRLIADLLEVPGGSASVLEAAVPYSEASLRRFLGQHPDRACVEETALMMAARALESAITECAETDGRPLGVGVTASLVSSRPKRGPHRVHAAVQSLEGTWSVSLTLSNGSRDRAGEEAVAADVARAAIAAACRLPWTLETRDDERPVTRSAISAEPVRRVRTGEAAYAVWSPSEGWSAGEAGPDGISRPAGLLSGSFNPVHVGHRRLREAAEHLLGQPVSYELPLRNADKPPLDDLRLQDRLSTLDSTVLLSNAATFREKAAAWPGSGFVIGMDTAVRVLDPRYYADGLSAALTEISEAGGRFLVATRWDGRQLWRLADCVVPADFAGLFEEIPPDVFREDVSSTQIRRGAAAAELRDV